MEEEKLFTELKQIRNLLAEVVGTHDLPQRAQFSKDALRKAASEFRNLQIDRGEWIQQQDISKIIRSAPYGAGKFIIKNWMAKKKAQKEHRKMCFLRFFHYFRLQEWYQFNTCRRFSACFS